MLRISAVDFPPLVTSSSVISILTPNIQPDSYSYLPVQAIYRVSEAGQLVGTVRNYQYQFPAQKTHSRSPSSPGYDQNMGLETEVTIVGIKI
jgi:hypothetical protein